MYITWTDSQIIVPRTLPYLQQWQWIRIYKLLRKNKWLTEEEWEWEGYQKPPEKYRESSPGSAIQGKKSSKSLTQDIRKYFTQLNEKPGKAPVGSADQYYPNLPENIDEAFVACFLNVRNCEISAAVVEESGTLPSIKGGFGKHGGTNLSINMTFIPHGVEMMTNIHFTQSSVKIWLARNIAEQCPFVWDPRDELANCRGNEKCTIMIATIHLPKTSTDWTSAWETGQSMRRSPK